MARKLAYTVPMILLLVVAFLVAFISPDVLASKGNPAQLMAQLQLLYSRVEMLSDTSGDSSDSLPVLQSYYDVLGKMQESYYGKSVNERQLTYDAIRGMLHSLNDPYTRFLDPDSYKHMREENEGNFVGIGAQLDVNKKQQVYIKEPLDDSPAIKAGVKAGDVILKVDEKPIAGMDIDKVVTKIRGAEGTKVNLTLLRAGTSKTIDVTITREIVEFRMVKSKMVDPKDGIGYIRLYGFNEHSDNQFEAAMKELEQQKMRGLIFDLRQNPGGLLPVAVDIGSRFIESGPIVITQERTGHRESLNVENEKHNHKFYPLVVVVDGQSASASEIVTGAIKDNGVGTIVGTHTFGKACVQTVSAMLDGSAIAITTAKYLTPSGRDINKVGVQPDVKVENPEMAEIGDLKQDVQLNKAIEVMKEKLNITAAKPH
jgi:carboxyl-terminal processing protease